VNSINSFFLFSEKNVKSLNLYADLFGFQSKNDTFVKTIYTKEDD